ncbi:MAG: tubulin-like doman-containing protein, partial [Chloroflexota bacterium]
MTTTAVKTENITNVRFQPTLFVYIGTSAGQTAYRVKKLLNRAYGNVPVLRHLWVDIDSDIDPQAQPYFNSSERAELSGLNPAAVIKNIDNYPAIKEWWPDSTQLKAGMLAGGGSPQQMRLVGRLALFRMFNDRTRGMAFIDRLRAATEALFEIENIRATQAKSTDKIKYSVDQGCRIVLVFSTSGGSGSSMSFDVAYLCRHLMAGKNPTVISISILPPVIDKAIQSETQTQKEKVRANTYAWFKEDNYLSENPFWNVQYPEGASVEVAAPPFDYRFVVDIENQAGYRLNSPDDVYNMIAQSIFLDTGSSIAGAMRGFTANVAALGEQFEGMRRSFSSLAAASLIYPKERLLEYCASRMGRSLLTDGLLGAADDHQVSVDAATLHSQLRLKDMDLLGDLLAETHIKMHYEPAINKADSVAGAMAQVDAQEGQNQAARRAETERLSKISAERLAVLLKGLNQEMSRLAATKGFTFAQAVFGKLLEPAATGMIESNVISLDGFKTRIMQQGVSDADLQMAKKEYEKSREALKRLDDGPEDVLERTLFGGGWKKKFAMFKRETITAMGKLNDLTLQLAAQQHAAAIYDQLASLASGLKARLSAAVSAANLASGELQVTAEHQASPGEAQANGYEFLQEINVSFADYYWEHATSIDPKSVFQSMVPARVIGDMDTLVQWTAEEVKPAALEYARHFFVADLDATSLLSTLKAMAEKRGIEPQTLVEEQLDRLVEYCHPFWQYDKDRGLSDLEGKSILGVEDENSLLIPASYRNGSLYEIKTTGFRDRIDVVRIQHGLPAFLIRGMDEYRGIYEKKRKGTDPLHVLPGMEFAPDLMPEQGRRGRDLFAIALAFGYIVQSGAWYYFDAERGYASHKIQPGREFRLAQGREKSEEVFSHHEEWARKVDQDVDTEVRSM